MKNTRNKVVLTESQLNSVIAESVRQVLAEIDWKTYMNAAKKRSSQYWDAHKKGDNAKADDLMTRRNALEKAAGRALSDKFGRKLNAEYMGNDSVRVMDDKVYWTSPSYEYGPTLVGGYNYYSDPNYDWRDIKNLERFIKSNPDRNPFGEYGNIPYDRERFDDETDDEYNEYLSDKAIGREIDDYTHGRYDYEKGNGWQLKK